MCKWSKWGDTRIDPCMREIVKWLKNKHITVACCCGHGKYPMTIIIKEGIKGMYRNEIVYREIFSGITFAPRRYIYKRDKQGHYYIPECRLEDEGVK
jgi:2-hydroxy-3-keto-5-methylthiopentenyl-1-phosphate phosphatase